MYRTSNVARLAGAVSLLAVLAAWGVLSLLVSGKTTVATWAVGLACMLPTSGLLLGIACNRSPPRTGFEYAKGFVASVVSLSAGYLAFATGARDAMRAVAGVGPVELVAATVGFALLGGTLALVDVRYVERPPTAARLEERYLDDPLGD